MLSLVIYSPAFGSVAEDPCRDSVGFTPHTVYLLNKEAIDRVCCGSRRAGVERGLLERRCELSAIPRVSICGASSTPKPVPVRLFLSTVVAAKVQNMDLA